jgi:ABC-type antimicrobial peptide transport system permease subunit
MSETFFSINDLLRRKLQTGLVVISLTLCVASTLFLLSLGDKIGFGMLSMAENRLTLGFASVFSSFITFVGFLTFFVGAVIIAFMVFVMMSQRIRDVGLMKAAGCPNDLIFGYFMNELVIVTFVSCLLGVVLGLVADFSSTSLLSSIGFQVPQEQANIWLGVLIFILFFVLSLIIGAKPILDTTKIEPTRAISPNYRFGLNKESDFKGSGKAGLTTKFALRSLFRRKSATFRIVLCLTAIFFLLTVAVAGGIIANETTKDWIEKAVGKDVILIAHHDLGNQYKQLLSKFYEEKDSAQFNYTDDKYLIPNEVLDQLDLLHGVSIDPRLLLETQIKEVRGIVYGQETGSTTYVGDNRKTISLIVGVEPRKVLSKWFLNGEFLRGDQESDAVIGDTIALKMFSRPLSQSLSIFGKDFHVMGVCTDPINNGNVSYVPLKILQNITDISKTNAVMARIDASANQTEVLEQMRKTIKNISAELEVFELNEELDRETGFIGYIWSAIMLLPLFALSAASLCLIGYVTLTIDEQRQEFGVLRAVGAKPRTIVKIVALQSLLILISSCATGIALGIMATLLVLIPEPMVTSYTIVEIAAWLSVALIIVFLLSLYPALKFARKPILEIMNQS